MPRYMNVLKTLGMLPKDSRDISFEGGSFVDLYIVITKESKLRGRMVDKDFFVSRASITKEYTFLILSCLVYSYLKGDGFDKDVDIVRVKKCTRRLVFEEDGFQDGEDSLYNKILVWSDLDMKVRQAQLVADLAIEVCWQLLDSIHTRQRIYLIPECGKEISIGDLSEEVIDNDIFITPAIADFTRIMCAYNDVRPASDNPIHLAIMSTGHNFGWIASANNEEWVNVLDESSEGIKSQNEIGNSLITYSSYRCFYVEHSCQIVAGYLKRNAYDHDNLQYKNIVQDELDIVEYDYASVRGGPPEGYSLESCPCDNYLSWKCALHRYQVKYCCNRPVKSGTPFAFVTISFSVPLGDVDFELGESRSIPAYAVYMAFDIKSIDIKKKQLDEITKILHRRISDLRLLATRQLAYAALARERDALAREKKALEMETRLRFDLVRFKESYLALREHISAIEDAFSEARSRLWTVTSMVKNRTALFQYVDECDIFFEPDQRFHVGDDYFTTKHGDGGPDDSDRLKWCTAVLLTLLGEGGRIKTAMTFEELHRIVSLEFQKDSPHIKTLKTLFLPFLVDGYPTARDSVFDNGFSTCYVFNRLKQVIHSPFKVNHPGPLYNISIFSAFPSCAWDEAIHNKLSEWRLVGESIYFKGRSPLKYYADIVFFLLALYEFADEQCITQCIGKNIARSGAKIGIDHIKNSNEITINFITPDGVERIFDLDKDGGDFLKSPIELTMARQAGYGFAPAGDFQRAFCMLLDHTLSFYRSSNRNAVRHFSGGDVFEAPIDGLLHIYTHSRNLIIANKTSRLQIEFKSKSCCIKLEQL